jgi:transcriptional regulator with GAF, ATPase, and Fis domain
VLERQRLQSGELNLRDEIRALEQTALAAALEKSGGNATQAARLLGAVGRGAARDPGGTVRAMKRRLGCRG